MSGDLGASVCGVAAGAGGATGCVTAGAAPVAAGSEIGFSSQADAGVNKEEMQKLKAANRGRAVNRFIFGNSFPDYRLDYSRNVAVK